jgi:hypothetical protein
VSQKDRYGGKALLPEHSLAAVSDLFQIIINSITRDVQRFGYFGDSPSEKKDALRVQFFHDLELVAFFHQGDRDVLLLDSLFNA